jgi:kynureninase
MKIITIYPLIIPSNMMAQSPGSLSCVTQEVSRVPRVRAIRQKEICIPESAVFLVPEESAAVQLRILLKSPLKRLERRGSSVSYSLPNLMQTSKVNSSSYRQKYCPLRQ